MDYVEYAASLCSLVFASFATLFTTADPLLVDLLLLEEDPDRLARVLAVCNAGYGSCLSAEAHDLDAELDRVEHLVFATAALSSLSDADNHAAAEEFEVQGVFVRDPVLARRVLDICTAGYGAGIHANVPDVDAELARVENLIVLDTNLETIAKAGNEKIVARLRIQPWDPSGPGVLTCEGCFGIDTSLILTDHMEFARFVRLVQAEDSLDALLQANNYVAFEHLRTRGWYMLDPYRTERVLKICEAGLGDQLVSNTGDFNAELTRLEQKIVK